MSIRGEGYPQIPGKLSHHEFWWFHRNFFDTEFNTFSLFYFYDLHKVFTYHLWHNIYTIVFGYTWHLVLILLVDLYSDGQI